MRTTRLSMLLIALATTACGASPAARPAIARAADGLAARQAAPAALAAPGARPPSAVRALDAPAAVDPAGGTTLELLTYNTWGKPGILGTDQKRRMGLIAPAIAPYQIVALQETFTGHARQIAQASGLPFQTWHRDRRWFDITTSGLFTLTRHAQVEVDFAPFKQGATWDRFAYKGVLFTRLDVPGVGKVDVYNTHYQAGAAHGKIREHDNAVLAALVAKHDAGWPTFLLGDFNMTETSPEYRDLMARLAPRDGFREANPEAPGYTSDPANSHKADEKSPKRIDFVFALPRDRWDVRFERVAVAMDRPVGGRHLSDHFGVDATVRISPR